MSNVITNRADVIRAAILAVRGSDHSQFTADDITKVINFIKASVEAKQADPKVLQEKGKPELTTTMVKAYLIDWWSFDGTKKKGPKAVLAGGKAAAKQAAATPPAPVYASREEAMAAALAAIDQQFPQMELPL